MSKVYKNFVFSDVHGNYDALIKSLLDAGYDDNNPTHRLISIGDAFDRGPQSLDIYRLLSRTRSIAIKGNHDEFFQEFLEKGSDGEFVLFNILHNGLGETIKSFGRLDDDFFKVFKPEDLDRIRDNILNTYGGLRRDIQKMPLYFETKNFIFCHAGINGKLSDWRDTPKDFMLWDITQTHLPCQNTNKFVVIGHHHVDQVAENAISTGIDFDKMTQSNGRVSYRVGNEKKTIASFGNQDKFAPIRIGNKIAIDGCVSLSNKVNVLVIEDEDLSDEQERETTIQVNPNNGFTYYSGIINDDIYIRFH